MFSRWNTRYFLFSFFLLGLVLVVSGCAKEGKILSAPAAQNEQALNNLSKEIAVLKAELRRRESAGAILPATNALIPTNFSSSAPAPLFELNESNQNCSSLARTGAALTGDPALDSLRIRIQNLEEKLYAKRVANNVSSANTALLANEMRGHTNLYSLKGDYKVMVIPVQFADTKFHDPDFISNQLQDYLFGDDPNTLTSYYRHASFGKFNVKGEVTPLINVDGNLANYGEAVSGTSDKAARELVVQALLKLKALRPDPTWWESFDNWDLNEYDLDSNRHEPDGFIDAVVLITAGKPQSSCQVSFDPDRTRPPSAEVPPGPRHDAAVECFNRLWPHRWSISIAHDDPRYSEHGPEVEGIARPSMNGLKISDQVFALDYNMQSEYSDRATFIHEFGHSLSLPDIYDAQGPGNSTGEWEVMSSTSHLQAQEQSTYSKVSLGWIEPKVVKKGQATSLYLGAYNYVTEAQREHNADYTGPEKVLENFDETMHSYDILSLTPGFGEPVYRAAVALMGPSTEEVRVVDMPEAMGTYAAYSGKEDGTSRSLKLHFKVPEAGEATLKFDMIHRVETETNFDSRDPAIRVVTDFDIGYVVINGHVQEELRLLSGDTNSDSLAEANPNCDATGVLALRTKFINEGLSDEEKKLFDEKVAACRVPVWIKKSYDLSARRGQNVEVEIRYVTDGGFTEIGIVVDNFELGSQRVDFEDANPNVLGQFELLKNGRQSVLYNQFYLFEYRTPGEEYLDSKGATISYNMDNHIVPGTQGFFQNEGSDILDRFRLFTIDYQPGVLVWYFNSKFNRTTNSPTQNGGKGYLLVLNSKVQEMKFPGIWARPELFNEQGEYDAESAQYKTLVDDQARKFKCFAAIDYYTYVDGQAPNCADVPAEYQNKLKELKFSSLSMVERREGFNNFLPSEQYAMYGVGAPMRNFAEMRTGLSTFRAPNDEAFRPIKVYKTQDGRMVLDSELTNSLTVYPPVSRFRDADNVLPPNSRFQGDTVVVEKKGFGFDIAAPSQRILSLYDTTVSADANNNFYRRPRAKIIFQWQ